MLVGGMEVKSTHLYFGKINATNQLSPGTALLQG